MGHCHHALQHSPHSPPVGKGRGLPMDRAPHSVSNISTPHSTLLHLRDLKAEVMATFLLKSVHHRLTSFRISPTYYNQRVKILWDQMCLPLTAPFQYIHPWSVLSCLMRFCAGSRRGQHELSHSVPKHLYCTSGQDVLLPSVTVRVLFTLQGPALRSFPS